MLKTPANSLSILTSALFLLLSACGGGGAESGLPSASTSALTITTSTLPGGSVGAVFSSTQLDAANDVGPTRWSVESGALPQGLFLSANGLIAGTPASSGAFAFVVRVSDDLDVATRSLSISVGSIGLSATGGLFLGDAWTEQPITLTTSGATGTVVFRVETNGSGGAFSAENALAGTATWTPGLSPGSGVDVLRATDQGNGKTASLSLTIVPNPAANHTATFGSTDVWWIDPAQKFGGHAYAADLHKALADVGLRATASTGASGSDADELALLYFRVELLRLVNPMFLRNADGSAGASGLAISFPLEQPGAGYTKPANGDWLSGSPTRYSQMGLVHGTTGGVIGTAFLDSGANGSHENDTTTGSLELGVFANQMVALFNHAYNNTLRNSPVDSADVPALKALLYELPNPGGRYSLIRTIGRGFARTVAATVAHEIGHSLGLPHTSPSQAGSIMNPAALISPSATYAFTAADVSTLQTALPGAGKTTSGQILLKGHVHGPEGGLMVCGCRAR